MTQSTQRPRVVFDCNVLLQAVANGTGPSGQSLRLLQQNQIDVFVSRAVLKELRHVLQYPSVRAKFLNLDDQTIDGFMRQLVFRATLVRKVPHVFDYPRATQDEPYVDLAMAAKANYLVSRDQDLLALATDHSSEAKQFRQRFPRLHIVNPVNFLKAVASELA